MSSAKRTLACACIFLAALILCSCSLKASVQNATRDVLSLAFGRPALPPGSSAGAISSPIPGQSAPLSSVPAATTRPIAQVDYWGDMELEWETAPETGYVWTITIDSAETVDMMGLLQVDYTMKLSCSHVGPDIFGVYRGELEMDYTADLDTISALMELTGGSMDYDADGWFKNDNFLMQIEPYSKADDESWVNVYGTLPRDEDPMVQAILDDYLGSLMGGAGGGEQDFEKNNSPAGQWFDWDFHMTEGDMSGFVAMTGIAYGTTDAYGSVDASGQNVQASADAFVPFVGRFSERYSGTIETPMPYTLEIYGEGQVVVTLYSANPSPITVKFYGTIDKIPVGQTQLVNR